MTIICDHDLKVHELTHKVCGYALAPLERNGIYL